MFVNNLGQCEHALYLGCRECSHCQIKAAEAELIKNIKAEAAEIEKIEYYRLLEKIERL